MDNPDAQDNNHRLRLSDIEAARRRPAMYVGDVDRHGLHQMLWYAIGASLNEHLAGTVDRIAVQINDDGSIIASDNGNNRGLAIGPGEGSKSKLETVLTTFRPASPLFGNPPKGNTEYRVIDDFDADLLPAVNALSSRFIADVHNGGYHWRQKYECGVALGDVAAVGPSSSTGKMFTFWPDPTIFDTTRFDADLILERLRAVCSLNPGLTAQIVDASISPAASWPFHFPDGLRSYVRHLNAYRTVLHEPISMSAMYGTTRIDVALQYNIGECSNVFTFVNNCHTEDGGTHFAGFYAALMRILNGYHSDVGPLDVDNTPLTWRDVRRGLSAAISVWLLEPSLESATKTRLHNPDVKGQVDAVVTEGLNRHFAHSPDVLEHIVRHCYVERSGES